MATRRSSRRLSSCNDQENKTHGVQNLSASKSKRQRRGLSARSASSDKAAVDEAGGLGAKSSIDVPQLLKEFTAEVDNVDLSTNAAMDVAKRLQGVVMDFSKRGSTSADLVSLWLLLARLLQGIDVQAARQVYEQMLEKKIGIYFRRFYEAWANFELSQGAEGDLNAVLSAGKKNHVFKDNDIDELRKEQRAVVSHAAPDSEALNRSVEMDLDDEPTISFAKCKERGLDHIREDNEATITFNTKPARQSKENGALTPSSSTVASRKNLKRRGALRKLGKAKRVVRSAGKSEGGSIAMVDGELDMADDSAASEPKSAKKMRFTPTASKVTATRVGSGGVGSAAKKSASALAVLPMPIISEEGVNSSTAEEHSSGKPSTIASGPGKTALAPGKKDLSYIVNWQPRPTAADAKPHETCSNVTDTSMPPPPPRVTSTTTTAKVSVAAPADEEGEEAPIVFRQRRRTNVAPLLLRKDKGEIKAKRSSTSPSSADEDDATTIVRSAFGPSLSSSDEDDEDTAVMPPPRQQRRESGRRRSNTRRSSRSSSRSSSQSSDGGVAGWSLQQPLPPEVSALFSERKVIRVNGRLLSRLELIGKGGSSKVFKVLCHKDLKMYALKRIKLQRIDRPSLSQYTNEITLLQRLRGNPNIIELIDSEVNLERRVIYMLMEHGEIDLNHKMQQERREAKPDTANVGNNSTFAPSLPLSFVRRTWGDMLEAVHAIHQERIVHGDLKPANFLFVQGKLKLIDFGIAKTISNDTTNIVRDTQIGTLNYMSPEAIIDTSSSAGSQSGGGGAILSRGPDRNAVMKVSRASDIWSMGCILYQMIYGRTPFSDLKLIQKINSITNPDYEIRYPEIENLDPSVVSAIKMCLQRIPHKRPNIDGPSGLLCHPFLNPVGAGTRLKSKCRVNDSSTSVLKVAHLLTQLASQRPQVLSAIAQCDPALVESPSNGGNAIDLARLSTEIHRQLTSGSNMDIATAVAASTIDRPPAVVRAHQSSSKIASATRSVSHVNGKPKGNATMPAPVTAGGSAALLGANTLAAGRAGLMSLKESRSDRFMRTASDSPVHKDLGYMLRKGISKKFENVHEDDADDVTMEGNNTWDLSELGDLGELHS